MNRYFVVKMDRLSLIDTLSVPYQFSTLSM